MLKFEVPTRGEVSESNQAIFDNLQKIVGFVPNLYAYMTKSETALADYLAFSNRKTSLKAREKEVVNLVVSQFNGCKYCLSAHTQIAKMNGFTDEQILEIRSGSATFDTKLNALVQFTLSALKSKGKADNEALEKLVQEGYNESSIIDIFFVIGEKSITNYIHNLAEFKVDFPLAEGIEDKNTKAA